MKTILIGIIIMAFCFLYFTFVEDNVFVGILLIGGFIIFTSGALNLLQKLISENENNR